MRFWDSSALVALFIEQENSKKVISLIDSEIQSVVWWISESECISAFARLEREGKINDKQFNMLIASMNDLLLSYAQVMPVLAVKQQVRRVLRTHPLRCADAYQLSAAILTSNNNPQTVEFVCLDDRLRTAASKEGFKILPEID